MELKPKPILTYSGDVGLFTSLAPSIIQALPQEPTEWKRSYGRVTKSVRVEASFVPFSLEILPRDGDWQLIKQPIFHIYWTECLDVDIYKTFVRDDIESWLKTLTQHNIQDWLIVHVETYDIRKSNKLLPRTTVIDKIRNDFASKQGDRCISVINPVRSESRSAESWRGLLSRIRLLLLTAYNHTLLRFEEAIRDQRERRNVQGWCFCQYFLLQEEMAFVLEMLGVYDEALVQYDELDALFTQFVLNSNAGETAAWLSTFQCHVENWSGLSLKKTGSQEKRALIKDCKASLLEFRCYLFSRQCAMLLLTLKPWEIAQRSLPFLHNCCKELAILEISCPEGALACWVFLCCLEVLSTCQRFSDSEQVELYSLYTASLWAYARDKLRELGELCGLMPGRQPSSAELHIVVGLSAGMGDPVGTDDKVSTPTDKLKEALSSQAAFKRQYLELAELAMGTYKHIGRIRSARLIGCDLASFYLRVGDTQKAVVFLSDALRMFEDENWHSLVSQTRLQLADCYKSIPDNERFVKMCSVIVSSSELDHSTKMSYFEQMMSTLILMKPESPLDTILDNSFKLLNVTVNPGSTAAIIEDSIILISIELDCLFPTTVHCTMAEACLESFKEPVVVQAKPAEDKRRRPSTPLNNGSGDESVQHSVDVGPPSRQLRMVEHLDFKEDKSLSSASIVARNPREFLRRSDSSNKDKKCATEKRDFLRVARKCKFDINPGLNKLTLEYKANEIGMFRVSQISLLIAHSMNFLSSVIEPVVNFKVFCEESTVTLNKGEKDLLTGLMQEMALTIKTGNMPIDENTTLALQCSRGLRMQTKSSYEPLTAELTVNIPQTNPFSTTIVILKVLADLPQQKDSHAIEHKVSLVYPWSKLEETITLHFQPPLMSSFRLHTAQTRKFAQVVVVGLNVQMLELFEPELTCLETQVKLTPLNPCLGQKLIVCDGINVSFLWQLDVGLLDGSSTIKLVFGVKYAPFKENMSQKPSEELDSLKITDIEFDQSESSRLYKCLFEVKNYKTLFVVGARVEPTKGSGEFCRAGTMCHLLLSVEGVNQSTHNSLMYEVLADQAMWAVCGRTAGVIALDSLDKQTVTLDVMPLIGGFLPLPLIRLSKYIPAVEQKIQGKDGIPRKNDVSMPTNHPRLEPFCPGQVYNSSKSQQVHVLPSVTPNMQEHSLS